MLDLELPKSAQRVQDVLMQAGVPLKVLVMEASTRTANDAAAAIGCEVRQIIKSLVFQTKDTGRPILVLASGVNRVNEKKVAAAVGEFIGKADADFTRTVTGFAIGGIPPVGHAQPIDTIIDETLLSLPVLWAAAGTPHTVFSLTPEDLLRLTNGKVIDLQ